MEVYPNFEVEMSSQSSDLGQEQLDEIEAKAQAKNTKRATEWGLKKFFTWSDKRKISVDLKTIAPKELNEVLRKFYAEVKTEKGQPLSPSALTGIRAAIHRHITSAPLSRNVNILQDSYFMSANKMFEAKAKLFTKENNKKPKHKQSIDSGDMEKLNKYFLEGQNKDGVWKDPEKLTEFVWFSLCYHFGRRGREGWRELTKDSFEIKTDDVGARCVKEKLTEQTKNHQGGSRQSDQLYDDVRMYETSNALDPVAAFEFYLSKTHPQCEVLFQTPNKQATSGINYWYKKEPLGKNTISKMMERISVKAELSERYTNHCVRASTITKLYQGGVDAKKICAITKHKDERSLTHYINQTTSAQKRECSSILTEAFQPGCSKQKAGDSTGQPGVPGASSYVSHALQNQFLALAQPYPNCTQHIQIGTMNVYYPSETQSTDSTDDIAKKRRRILESDPDTD